MHPMHPPLFLLALFVGAQATDEPVGRAAHYVIRTSKLEKSVEFFKAVMGMKVIRHEENDKPCPITCNGDSPTAWSKTMIGYETEDKAYAFEVTYNYGVESYAVGTGLASFTVSVDDVQAAATAAGELKYLVRNNKHGQVMVVGPDGYRFQLVAKPSNGRHEPFLGVRLHVSDVEKSKAFYTRLLRMSEVATLSTGTGLDAAVAEEGDAALQYAPGQVNLLLRPTGGSAPKIEQYEGRHAFSMPAATLQAVYKQIEDESPELIVHAIMELEEALGTLFIAIVKDPDGFEICLVSSETFDKAVLSAADWKEPDWTLRGELIATRRAAAVVTKKKAAEAAIVGVFGGGGVSTYVPPSTNSSAAGDGGGGESGGVASLAARVFAVAAHVRSTIKEGEYAKSEGNFIAFGYLFGFLWAFLPLPVLAALLPVVLAVLCFMRKSF
mmetsp:Transcript_1249/g.2670  ORF Transcript_1249/g.2670 Transcript_1249/m.2670 type:complete len:439 (+) Transcript_1249:63-1379(+)|eukprot:CAMPEP_0171952980 /NCGR_PEP_ID=MMETSP0993-20121228/93733_1 /TAXON_ID=483369 /ORGANISM="non described non described, Strain CCMP2098" /LENGTH=438 /DNA_ID=CAMNT_0012598559 /DNA_START=23 /DNA_END=1339 /DNA_ORIENTATION=+